MNGAQSVTAAFVPLYPLTVTKSGTGSGTVTSAPAGINCGGTCSASYAAGTSVALTAAPASGTTFTGWNGACSGTTLLCSVVVGAATAVTATFAPSSASAYHQSVVASGPAAYWRLGEVSGTTASDVTNVNPGSYQNGPTLAQGSLLATDPNPSVAFDGTNDRVRVPDSASLDASGALTLEAWIRPNALPAAGAFASVITKPEAYSLQFNGSRLELTVVQSGVRRRLQAPVGAVVAGQTYHVVGTYDGTTQRLYLNGQLVVSAALSGAASVNANPVYIGSWDGSGEYFNGCIDEAAVYSKALSAATVTAHYNAS
jgi:hypothetical protein